MYVFSPPLDPNNECRHRCIYQSKDLEKNLNYQGHSARRYTSINEWRQQSKPVIDGTWETKNGRSTSSEYPNTLTLISGGRNSQYLVSRISLWIVQLAVKWFQKLIKEGPSFICAMHFPYHRDHTFMTYEIIEVMVTQLVIFWGFWSLRCRYCMKQ